MATIAAAMRWAWTASKLAGRWLGPLLIGLAAYFHVFPPMPFMDAAQAVALPGAVIAAIACLFMRAPVRRRARRVTALLALSALAFCGWRYWEHRQGHHEEIVAFDNRGARLTGTLLLPDKPKPVPGIVFLQGSGAIPRGFYRGYAEHFAKSGYAVLLYDKRGAGDSSGTYQAAGVFDLSWNLELLASDAAAGLKFLSGREEVRGMPVGFAGLSEGGLISPRAAVLGGEADFMLILTSTAASVYRLARHQLRNQRPGTSDSEALAQAEDYFGGDFDPGPSLRELDIPGLWVLAEGDTHDPNDETVRILERLAREGKPYSYEVIPGASHGLFAGPRDRLHRVVDDWLAEVTAPSP